MTEPVPDPISPTATRPLTSEELDKRVEKRKKEIESQPCYRCGHSAASPEQGCACCFWAHTPLPDGTFKEAA